MRNVAGLIVFVVATTWHTVFASAALVIQAEKATIKTEGGPNSSGGWNLWSNGRVGQPLRFAKAETYGIVIRAWGSPAGGVWPEMAPLVDGKAVQHRCEWTDDGKPNSFRRWLKTIAKRLAIDLVRLCDNRFR